ncbi:peptide-binding protein [Humisphaera borealis]|uniref:Peptide-binding protein n=1 Tax=Humisphaera borealis TaxID=2807512 RepID=A0A7M2WUP7_9BACT|nr:peptide-binding protein [Humisphaera borealis]QOV89257.1 peptide-binding protein [Humisphaera borealis]
MENRFGIKDLFLFLLIGALLVIVALAMWQFDRQFSEIRNIKQQNTELTADLTRVKTAVAGIADTLDDIKKRPVVVGPAQGTAGTQQAVAPAATPTADAFTRLKEAEKQPGFARGDWLIDNFATKIGKLTPLVSSDVYQTWVEYQVMEGLAVRDPDTLEYVPRLARNWTISEDGLTMTFTLRRGVSFSDGAPMTADDVVFTLDWVRNPAVNADRVRSYLTKLTSVKKIDDLTVEFKFSEYYYLNFGTIVDLTIMPKHFYGKFTPDQFNEKTGLLMGTGPYRLENPETWSPGERVVLLRNPRYWGTPPTFNRIVFNEIEGENTEMVRFGNQELDLIRCVPAQFEKLRNDPRIMAFSNAVSYDNMYGGYTYVAWNQMLTKDGKETPTPFADKRVRQAMTMLLDRERILSEIYLGYGSVASGPFGPKSKQYNPAIKAWPHSPDEAKKLLAEAGYIDRNGDGIVESDKGVPLKFKLTYPSGNESTEKVVLFMKDNFTRGGVVMEPDRVDWPVLVQKLNQTDFEAVTLGWSSTPESDPYQVFHSSQITGQGDNRTHYINKELDKLIEQARGTVKTDDRMKLWQKVHAILHEDQPYTFLFNRKALRLFNNRIQNIKPAAIGLNFEYLNGDMFPWYVPAAQQKYKD